MANGSACGPSYGAGFGGHGIRWLTDGGAIVSRLAVAGIGSFETDVVGVLEAGGDDGGLLGVLRPLAQGVKPQDRASGEGCQRSRE
jgi:hypothetical protein